MPTQLFTAVSMPVDFTSAIACPANAKPQYQKQWATIMGRTTPWFTDANTKLQYLAHALGLPKTGVVQFDLPAAYTCPCAHDCKMTCNRITGKLSRYATTQFDCYAARAEAQYANVRALRWMNLQHLVNADDKAAALLAGLDARRRLPDVCRLHSSGDVFNQDYFEALNKLAYSKPTVQFFGYTKVLDYVLERKPANFNLQYSYGSLDDHRWTPDVPTCFVVKTYADAAKIGVPVVCDTPETHHVDYFKILAHESFALLVH